MRRDETRGEYIKQNLMTSKKKSLEDNKPDKRRPCKMIQYEKKLDKTRGDQRSEERTGKPFEIRQYEKMTQKGEKRRTGEMRKEETL